MFYLDTGLPFHSSSDVRGGGRVDPGGWTGYGEGGRGRTSSTRSCWLLDTLFGAFAFHGLHHWLFGYLIIGTVDTTD